MHSDSKRMTYHLNRAIKFFKQGKLIRGHNELQPALWYSTKKYTKRIQALLDANMWKTAKRR